jgi:mannose-6-phosphate isomerase-like protein (cupin superfamily)
VPLVRPGEGETVTDRAERTVRILFAHELADVTWSRYEPGERGPDPHVHRRHVDSFFVLEGELLFGVGPAVEEEVWAPAGTFVSVPQNVVHTFANESSRRTLFLNFHTPSCGFAESLRGRPEGFDSFDPPADGGRPAAHVIVEAEGERLPRPDGEARILGEQAELSAQLLSYEAGWEGVDPHSHDDHVDSFFVLEGEVEFLGASGGPGSFFAAPPGELHAFRNPGPGRIAVLNVHAPDAGFAGRLRG